MHSLFDRSRLGHLVHPQRVLGYIVDQPEIATRRLNAKPECRSPEPRLQLGIHGIDAEILEADHLGCCHVPDPSRGGSARSLLPGADGNEHVTNNSRLEEIATFTMWRSRAVIIEAWQPAHPRSSSHASGACQSSTAQGTRWERSATLSCNDGLPDARRG